MVALRFCFIPPTDFFVLFLFYHGDYKCLEPQYIHYYAKNF